jgi:hypothetical protein
MLRNTRSCRTNIYLPIYKTALYSPPLCSRVNLKIAREFFRRHSSIFVPMPQPAIASVVLLVFCYLLHLLSLPNGSMDSYYPVFFLHSTISNKIYSLFFAYLNFFIHLHIMYKSKRSAMYYIAYIVHGCSAISNTNIE